ncbi:MAG TPA: hypothetical protein VL286_07440 [Rhizomicrobium sp.]|nr:hypothetical protein [Rhizomicrobium sp.]
MTSDPFDAIAVSMAILISGLLASRVLTIGSIAFEPVPVVPTKS